MADYSRLRKTVMERIRRLEKAGVNVTFRPARKRDLKSEKEINRETKRLEKWLSQERNTVKGARKAREERLEKKRQAERKRYAERRAAEGKAYNPRKPSATAPTEPTTGAAPAAAAPAPSKTVDEELEDLLLGLTGGPEDKELLDKYNALKNLLSGLRKYGVEVEDLQTLEAWGQYIKERNQDSERDFYLFPIWIDQLFSSLDKDADEKVSADDITDLTKDFNEWLQNEAALTAEFFNDIGYSATSSDVFDLWSTYIRSED